MMKDEQGSKTSSEEDDSDIDSVPQNQFGNMRDSQAELVQAA